MWKRSRVFKFELKIVCSRIIHIKYPIDCIVRTFTFSNRILYVSVEYEKEEPLIRNISVNSLAC